MRTCSGYVRILHEMIAAGWSDAEVSSSVREMIGGWYIVGRRGTAREGARRRSRPVHARGDRGALMGLPFIGAESMLLLGMDETVLPARPALRKVGAVLRQVTDQARGQ